MPHEIAAIAAAVVFMAVALYRVWARMNREKIV